MKIGDKIVSVDGPIEGEVWELIKLSQKDDFATFRSQVSGATQDLSAKELFAMEKIGSVRIMRNGFERAKRRARQRIPV